MCKLPVPELPSNLDNSKARAVVAVDAVGILFPLSIISLYILPVSVKPPGIDSVKRNSLMSQIKCADLIESVSEGFLTYSFKKT